MGNKLNRIAKGRRSQATFVGDINLREARDTLNDGTRKTAPKAGQVGVASPSKVKGKRRVIWGLKEDGKQSPQKALSVDHDNYFTAHERKQYEGSCTFSKPKFQDPIHWKRGELLGSGAFGRVFLGLHTRTGELMAAKQIVLSVKGKESDQCLRALENEIKLMRKLDHKNIVRYWGTERTDKNFTIFMEYIPGGSISSLLKKFGSFNETLVRVYTKQILEGLHYLHSHRIMHRDIKGGNILVDRGGVCKLSDFGAAKHLSELTQATAGFQSLRGTPYWMAPEVVRQTGAGRQADIWSVGCTIIEMATGKPPFSHFETPVSALFHIAVAPEPPAFPDVLSDTAHDFLRLCFMKNPQDRPNAITLLQHPFITSSFLAAPSMRSLRSSYDLTVDEPDDDSSDDEEEEEVRLSNKGSFSVPNKPNDAERNRSLVSVSSFHSSGSGRSRTTPKVRKVFPFTHNDAASVKSSNTAPVRGDGRGAMSAAGGHGRMSTNKQRLVFSGAQDSQPAQTEEASPFIWRKAAISPRTVPGFTGGVGSGGGVPPSSNSNRGPSSPHPSSSVGRQSSQGISSAEASIGSHNSLHSNERRRQFTDADWHRHVGDTNSSAYESYRSYVEGPNPYSTPGSHHRGSVATSMAGTPKSGAPRAADGAPVDALDTELRRVSVRQRTSTSQRSPSPGGFHDDDAPRANSSHSARRTSRASRRGVTRGGGVRRRADGEALHEERDVMPPRPYDVERQTSLRERGRQLSTSTHHSYRSHHSHTSQRSHPSDERDWDGGSEEYHTPRGGRRRFTTGEGYDSRGYPDDRYRRDGYHSQPRRRRASPYSVGPDDYDRRRREWDRDYRDREHRSDRDRDREGGDYFDFRDVASEGGGGGRRRQNYDYDDRDHHSHHRGGDWRDFEHPHGRFRPLNSVTSPQARHSHRGRTSVASHHSRHSRHSPPPMERDEFGGGPTSRQARWEADLALASEVAVNLLPPPSTLPHRPGRAPRSPRSNASHRDGPASDAGGVAVGPSNSGSTVGSGNKVAPAPAAAAQPGVPGSIVAAVAAASGRGPNPFASTAT